MPTRLIVLPTAAALRKQEKPRRNGKRVVGSDSEDDCEDVAEQHRQTEEGDDVSEGYDDSDDEMDAVPTGTRGAEPAAKKMRSSADTSTSSTGRSSAMNLSTIESDNNSAMSQGSATSQLFFVNNRIRKKSRSWGEPRPRQS
jgi:hypothetical protein